MTDYSVYLGTRPVAEAHRFDVAALERYMRDHAEGFVPPLAVEQFKGGQSNPTYRLVGGNGKAYVMRRKPPGKLLPSAHAVDREYRVITALHATGFPVARTYALCTDESVVGTMFYIMDCVEGRVLWDPQLPGIAAAERGAMVLPDLGQRRVPEMAPVRELHDEERRADDAAVFAEAIRSRHRHVGLAQRGDDAILAIDRVRGRQEHAVGLLAQNVRSAIGAQPERGVRLAAAQRLDGEGPSDLRHVLAEVRRHRAFIQRDAHLTRYPPSTGRHAPVV